LRPARSHRRRRPRARSPLLAAIGTGLGTKARHRLQSRLGAKFFLDHVRTPAHARRAESATYSAESNILEVRDQFAATLMNYSRRLAQPRRLPARHCHIVHVQRPYRSPIAVHVLNDRGKPLARNDILKAIYRTRAPRRRPSRI